MNKAKRLAIFVTSLSLIISMTGTAFAQNKVNEDIKLVTELSPNEIEEVNLIENKTSICSRQSTKILKWIKVMFLKLIF